VVVLHDEPTVALAAVLRERGMHAIWHLRPQLESPARRGGVAGAFPRLKAGPVDACVLSWGEPSERSPVERVAALLPKARLVIVKDAATAGSADASARNVVLAWISILGDVVEYDRDDHVGGTVNARPFVARR
jgi:hypothetical protein